ncbi:Rod shape-determining protein RodA [Alloalcanivorax dieselolei B5]|uniref:Rod shape-determining protein RodA n=1 Tax=Alcanivorax dieselolei (strain DSM 16502 / CGMCC 1.3690 / MCCC 1A00001 / B-5) TaxID=930169 RepID=K0CDR4_ALCDB|nr:DUF4399 domain-containing protein [Alloalcanivorax dieselolei]AFT70728.1 Rod shape-determining protein RodA [Alloalcanivorax dieselolei B5]GGJ97355.1 hypothetical protein GCM10007426_27950 [Alloalcanivorax dieselolei]
MKVLLTAALLVLAPFAAAIERTPAPPEAEVYFITPQDGDTVSGPVTVKFGLKGMGVAPAGVTQDNTGHHHLLVDLKEAVNEDQPLPSNDNVRHFGGGQTETTLDLPPGEHTLQLIMGDARHVPFEPSITSEEITITVK